jgi:8-oxo-dGTP pyrophosphatase MutT (NUDIX family)
LNGNGQVLLVKHNYGRLNWELPGGGAEDKESIVETALREVREETGLDVVAQQTTGIYYEAQDDMLHFVFLCQPLDVNAQPQANPDEITECAYWSPDALPRPISDFTVRRIQDAVTKPGMPLPTMIEPRQWLM